MSMQFSRLALRGLVLAVAFHATQALAADPKAVADALVAASTANGKGTATYENATASGDDITITGFKMAGGEGDDAATVTVPTIVVSGATERQPGGFTATRMTLDGGSLVADDGNNFTWQTAAIDNPVIPSAEEVKAKARMAPFSKLTMGGLTVKTEDAPVPIDIASVDLAMAVDASGTPNDFQLNIGSMKIPPEFFADDPQQKAILDSLGYTSGFTINVGVDGAYATATDTLNLRSFSVDTVDLGKLTIVGIFTGVPLSKLADESQASDIQSTGKLQSLSLRFDNSGIVERVLDMQAQQTGMKREELVAQLSAGLPFMLNVIGNPGFQEKLGTAAVAFLNDPKSITFTASPTEPVPFGKLMEVLFAAPQTAPDVLAVGVTAND